MRLISRVRFQRPSSQLEGGLVSSLIKPQGLKQKSFCSVIKNSLKTEPSGTSLQLRFIASELSPANLPKIKIGKPEHAMYMYSQPMVKKGEPDILNECL